MSQPTYTELEQELYAEEAINKAAAIEIEKLRAQNAELLTALENITGTIQSHETESLSCDRDGEKYCDCVELATAAAQQAIARAKS